MFSSFLIRLFLVVGSLFPLMVQASIFGQAPNFVHVNQAFNFDFSQQGNQLTLHWAVKPGYYLYRQKISITAQQATLATWQLPPGKPHKDEFFGDSEIYPQDLSVPLTLQTSSDNASLQVTYQGCAAAGFCYPPETRTVPLSAVQPLATTSQGAADTVVKTNTQAPFSPLWALLFGIGVAFTPCVLPMYPLISGIILGGRRNLSLGRTAWLAIVYVQGMAITYTLLGLLVAAAGLRFQAALQNPILLVTLSILFIIFAFSMFGAFSLQLPSALQTRLTLWSNRQRGGSFIGVLVMGSLAGLICSPCTTAPLSTILLYIAQSGQLSTGAGTLYLYALGMGLPLILVTLFGNKVLPRSGSWMQVVKEGVGFIILALPVFLLERVLGDTWGLRLWSLLGVSAAGWALVLSIKSEKRWARWFALLWIVLAIIAARPLQDSLFTSSSATQKTSLLFTQVTNTQQLHQRLASNHQQITMLDLYADWCVACKEFDKYTFTDPRVKQAFNNMQLLQANVTKNSHEDNQLLASLNVLGLPTLLFFDAQGKEIPNSRISGYLNPQQFLTHLSHLQ